MDDGKTESLLEGIKITIAMQQRVPVADAVGCNQQIHGLADRVAGAAEVAVIPGGIDRQRDVMELEDFEVHEL